MKALGLTRGTGRRARNEKTGEEEPILETLYPVYSLRHAYASIQIDIGINP